MSPVKVLVISDYRATVSSRPEAEAMIGLKQQGLDLTIMTFPEAEYVKRFEQEGIRVIGFHPRKKFNREEISFIREELVRGDYDILQLFNSKAIINGIAAAKKLPVKVVLYRGYTGHVNWYDPSAYFKYLHPRVDRIICLTDSVKKHIDRNPFFDRQKTVTILKGHHPSWYAGVQPADPGKFGVPDGAFVVITVGNVRRFKGIPYLIKSSMHLPPGLPIHFLLVGKGMDSPPLKKLIEASGYASHFHFPGFVEDPLPLVAASKILVLASLGGEAINKSVIEAMNLGVTPVITDIAGNRDLWIPGAEELVVPTRDPKAIAGAILHMYNNPALCREYGEKARQHVSKHLHISNTVQQIKKLYEELAAEKAGS